MLSKLRRVFFFTYFFLFSSQERKERSKKSITHAGKRYKKESPHGSGIRKNPALEREEKENLKSVTFKKEG
ncbi:MAG: hypothetical protein IPG24_05085 [Leptospiraceae bacterium]|nr:hypothetical protein [Leptospiraceae bacterium]